MMRFQAICVIGFLLSVSQTVFAGSDWNDRGINWRPYQQGMALAIKSKRPVCLVIYTESCPHCRKYSSVFRDPEVIKRSKKFVMIRIEENDNTAAICSKYKPDGRYVPRSFLLSSKGKLEPSIRTGREKYKYFYDTGKPEGLLKGMDQAQKKWPGK